VIAADHAQVVDAEHEGQPVALEAIAIGKPEAGRGDAKARDQQPQHRWGARQAGWVHAGSRRFGHARFPIVARRLRR
jgi:hypothetical protein